MSFHELGHDLVFAGELGFELLDLFLLGIFDGLAFAAVLKSGMAVLEELLLPVVELVDLEAEFLAEVGDGYFVDQVSLKDSDFFGAGKMTTRLLVHDVTVHALSSAILQIGRFG